MVKAKIKKKTVAKKPLVLKKSAKKHAPVGKKKTGMKMPASLFLPAECAVIEEVSAPELALPASCEIEEEIEIAPLAELCELDFVEPRKKSFWHFSFSSRMSFWIGVFFGVAIMSLLTITFWALFSAQFVWASVN